MTFFKRIGNLSHCRFGSRTLENEAFIHRKSYVIASMGSYERIKEQLMEVATSLLQFEDMESSLEEKMLCGS